MNRIDLQVATTQEGYPSLADFQYWVDAVLEGDEIDTEMVIRLVDVEESGELNRRYRDKHGPTNVLSFPFEMPEGVELAYELLGDLVICAPVVADEARRQNKEPNHHWAHIVIHGVLHLLGYDHIDDAEAEEMEAKEVEILQTLNIVNPYLEESIQ